MYRLKTNSYKWDELTFIHYTPPMDPVVPS